MILLIIIIFLLDYILVLMLLGENWCWSLLWLQGLTKNNDFFSSSPSVSFPWYCLLWILSCILWRTGTRALQSLHRDMMEKTSMTCQRLRKNQRINLRWLYKSFSLDNLYKTIVVLLFENCGFMSPEYRVHNETRSSFYLQM